MTKNDTAIEPAAPGRFNYVELALRLAALALILYWSIVLIRPFIAIIAWSVVLAVSLYPTFSRVAALLGGRRRLAATLVSVVFLLILFGPVAWVAVGVADAIRALYEQLASGGLSVPAPPPGVKAWPLVGDALYQFWDLAFTNLKAATEKVMVYVKPYGRNLLGMARGAGLGALEFLASVIVAGLLLPSGPSLVDGVKRVFRRIDADRGDAFVDMAGVTIRTVSRGVIGISLLQALLAGIGLFVAGVPAAGLITFAVLVLGIIQIGPSIVLIPLIVWSWMTMETGTALLFTVYFVPVNLLDNLLRPLVMGRGLTTPLPVILIGVIGGTLAHGIVGLFLGPIVLAVCWELLVVWTAEPATSGTAPAASA
jgi:predicted PurR-regulated permease PerM